MSKEPKRICYCKELQHALPQALQENNLRWGVCIDAILEAKNELVRENQRLCAENNRLQLSYTVDGAGTATDVLGMRTVPTTQTTGTLSLRYVPKQVNVKGSTQC